MHDPVASRNDVALRADHGCNDGESMTEQQTPPAGTDLAQGVAPGDFTGGTLLGHVGDQDVLLVRFGQPSGRVRHGAGDDELNGPAPFASKALQKSCHPPHT
jgi:hypothetical protein